jgi:hypothetical protein
MSFLQTMEWITYKSLILLTEIINCKERYSVYSKILVTFDFLHQL